MFISELQMDRTMKIRGKRRRLSLGEFKKSIIDATSPITPCKSSFKYLAESKSIVQLESFLGVEGNDQDLFGIKGTEETINVLNTLAEIWGGR